MKKRKYTTEYGACFGQTAVLATTVEQLMSGGEIYGDEEKIIAKKCHIYMIVSFYRLSFVPGTLVHDNGLLSGKVEYTDSDGSRVELDFFGYEYKLSSKGNYLIVSEYPHRDLIEVDSEGNYTDLYLPGSFLARWMARNEGIFMQGKVLYVGQAIGDGNRSAFDRLSSHSKLQKILSDIQSKKPNLELWVLTFEFDEGGYITTMDGRDPGVINTEENEDRLINAMANPPSKKQAISMIEAGLIRYFQPEYNKIYRKSFVSKDYKILDSCRKTDVSGLSLYISSDEVNIVLYSDEVEAKGMHFINYNLFANTGRASCFDLYGFGGFPGLVD